VAVNYHRFLDADGGFPSSLCNTASYVDITAKTDTYVGFLPSYALERLLEKRPIVLLTLAKRLISLLSPLGKKKFTPQNLADADDQMQSCRLMLRWTGCRLTPDKYYGDPAMSATAFIL
jgi:hypothetical protein